VCVVIPSRDSLLYSEWDIENGTVIAANTAMFNAVDASRQQVGDIGAMFRATFGDGSSFRRR
jgi:hypothetical protein